MVTHEDYSEAVKIMDFGIARIIDFGTTNPLTRAGVIMGTPAYMAPEQAEGAAVSEKTDIYALGIVLYEMLSGAVPFKAATPGAVLIKQIKESPLPLRKLRREVPRTIEHVVMQALAKEPKRRQQTMHEVVKALAEAGTKMDGQQTPKTMLKTLMLDNGVVGRARRPKSPAVWIGLTAVIITVGLALIIGRLPDLTGAKEQVESGITSSGEPAAAPASPDAAADRGSSEKRESDDRSIQEHVNVARFHRNRGELLDALAELDKARSLDPANKSVQEEIRRTKTACLSQKNSGAAWQACD
jgi:serine/threonine protein kinase